MRTIIREGLAMIVLVSAIALITTLVFFDYIKEDANQPQSEIYEVSKEEQNILKEKEEYDEKKETLLLKSMYSVDENELSGLKASGEFSQGQSSPFDETPITDIVHDREGNIYYQINNKTSNNTVSGNNANSNTVQNNVSNTSNNTSNTNSNKKNGAKDNSDLSSPSDNSGSLMVTQKNSGGK